MGTRQVRDAMFIMRLRRQVIILVGLYRYSFLTLMHERLFHVLGRPGDSYQKPLDILGPVLFERMSCSVCAKRISRHTLPSAYIPTPRFLNDATSTTTV